MNVRRAPGNRAYVCRLNLETLNGDPRWSTLPLRKGKLVVIGHLVKLKGVNADGRLAPTAKSPAD
jgi:hypothetical protein